MTQESVFDQPMKSTPNLPFEVIAVPQYDNTRLVNSANYNLNDPINIKIRIRNKEEKGDKYGIVSAPKLFAYNSKEVRLVSSDQTIMSFDLFVEPNTSKKIQKKSHKNFFHFFKPRGCLRIQNENDDKSSYLPGATNDVAMIKSTCSIVETNNISEKNVLKKTFPRIPSSERTDKQLKAFMGICKPGGCLDPPFNEDKYSYKPALEHSSTSLKYKTKDKKELRQEITSLYTDSGVKIKMKETSENNGKPQLEDNGEPDADSLITYPTSSSSNEFRVHKESHDMKLKSRLSSENKARISMNEFSEIFFMPPKKEKSKSKGENLTGKVCMIKDTDIDTVNHSTESPTVIIESKSLIEDEQENAKYVELIENIKSSKENLHNIDTDVNTVLNTRSQDLLNIKYMAEFPLENKVSNIQNYAYDKSIINTDIQKKETKEQDDFAENYKETNKNKNEEAVDIDDVKLSLKNITIQKSNSITIANPVNKTKDLLYSFSESINALVKEHKEIADMGKLIDPSFKSKEFQNTDLYTNANYIAGLETEAIEQHNSSYDCKESFKKELEENNDTITIKTTDSKEMQNVELNNNVNYQIIESKEFKDSVQESRESFKRKLEDITNAAEIKATLLKSKHDDNLHTNSIVSKDAVESKESQYSQKTQETSLKLSIDDPSVNELKNTFIMSEDIDEDNLETNKTTDNYFDRDKNVEFYQNLNNNLPDAYQTVFSSDKNIDIETCNKENLISTSKPEKGYVQELVDKNLGKDIPLTSNNAETDSRIESIPFTEIPRQASEVNSTRKQMSLILIRDEQVENIFRSTHVDKKDSPIENLKHFYSSESVTNALESNRNINDINKGIGGSCKSENSIIHKNLKPLDDESLQIKVKSSSKILDVNECNNNRPDFRVANSDNEDYTKTVNLTNLEHLQNVYLKQSDTNNIEKPFDEDFATTMYSSIAIDFGFRYSVDNDKLIIKSVDTLTPLNKGVGDKISIIKSMIRPNGDEIRIPIDLDIDLALVIKKASNEVTTSHMEHKSEQKINEKLVENTAEKEDFLQETLSSVYKTLVPINMIIQKLREEANILSRQQTSIKETLKIMEKKPMRLIHTNALCGCRKK